MKLAAQGAEIQHLERHDPQDGKRIRAYNTSSNDWIIARRPYHYGTRYSFGTDPTMRPLEGQDLWPDAEAYLDVLESASHDNFGPAPRVLQRIIGELLDDMTQRGPTLQEVLEAARRGVAIECAK